MNIRILTGPPAIVPLAQMALMPSGLEALVDWLKENRPAASVGSPDDLLPRPEGHSETATDNELLAELAGRKCYDSFGDAGKARTCEEYLRSMWVGRIPHRSTGYHPHMTFFIGNVSRRVSQELMRNYIGHAKDEEGAPSQESTRYTLQPGAFVAPPRVAADPEELEHFREDCERGYERYTSYIGRETEGYVRANGKQPTGLDRKRIWEAAIGRLPWQFATSFVWTSNPMALSKFFEERCDVAADMEMQQFANAWRDVCLRHWPALFCHLSDNARGAR